MGTEASRGSSLLPAPLPPLASARERAARRLASPAWNGQGFGNRLPSPLMQGARFETARRFVLERAGREPPGPLPSVRVDSAVLTGPAAEGLRATWLGHSTVLIEIGGKRVLLDPVWSERASPVTWGGPKRFQPVPVDLAALPLPDVVLVSHDHYDHLDRATVIDLAARGARFVTALGVGEHLESWGISPSRIAELDWWESCEPVPGLRIHAAPARHFSGRSLFDRNRTLWASYCIAAGGQRVFFGGDGGLDEQNFAEIGRRLGPFDLTLLEIGAFDPAWASIHLGPDNAVRAHGLLGGKVLLPVHWGTFSLGLHVWDAPIEQLLRAADPGRVALALPRLGESVVPAGQLPSSAWWRALRSTEAGAQQILDGNGLVARLR